MATPGSYLATEIGELSAEASEWIDRWANKHEYNVYYSDNEMYALMNLDCSALPLDEHRVAFWRGNHRHEKSYKSLDDASGDINRWVLQGTI